MAGFFKLFSRTASTSSLGRSRIEDSYQKITDHQPLNEYKDVMLLEGHTAPVRRILKISQSCFVTAGDDSSIIIWNSESGIQMHVLNEHTGPVTSLCLLRDEPFGAVDGALELESGDSLLFMSASTNEIIRWEMSIVDERFDPANNCKRMVEHKGTVNCLMLLRHGMVCSGGKDLCLWDIASGKLLSKYDWSQQKDKDNSEIFSILELEGRNFGIVAVSNHSKPAVFDIKKSTMTQSVTYELEFCSHVLSYHHLPISVLAPVSSTLFATGALDGTVVIWSMNSLTMVKRFECIEDEGYDFTMSSPVSTTSSSSTQAGSVPVTHIMTLCERYMFVATGKGFKVFDIYSSDGGSPSISEIPVIPKPILVHSNAHNHTITSMQFLPEKNILITSSLDCSVRLWGSRGVGPASRSKRDISPTINGLSVELQPAVEAFLGLQETRQLSRKRSQVRFTPMVPLLIGELCLHTGSVQNVLYLGPELGVVTIGNDNNVLLWKESELEREKRDEEIQKHLRGEMFYDAN